MPGSSGARPRNGLWRIALIAALLLLPGPAARAFDPGFREPLAQRLSAVADDLHRRRESGRQVSLRSYSNAALIAVALGEDPAKAATLLEVVLAAQDEATGELPWLQPGRTRIGDKNAIEFATQAWGPLLLGFADRLPVSARDTLQKRALAALPALARSNPPLGATNIYLMNAVNTLLIGQAVGDAEAVRRGRDRLRTWRETVLRDGVREFGSPTYYATDLNSLVVARLYAADAEDRRRAEGMLDFLWSDIAAHTVEGRLVGPHSRDYDTPFGEGPLNLYLAAEGWRPLDDPKWISPESVFTLLNMGPGGYRVRPEIAALAMRPDRTVLARWGSGVGQTRALRVEGGAAIGSVGGGTLSSTDKLFTIDLRRGPGRSVTIGFVPSTADTPLNERRASPEGRNAFWHPPVNAGMVQRGGWVLGSYDINPSREKGAARFTTSLLLPREADELLLDGRPFRGEAMPATGTSVVAIRVGGSCAAIRLLRADSDGAPGLMADGRVPEVARLVIPQAADSPRARIAFLARAGRCGAGGAAGWAGPVAEAPVREAEEGGNWSLGATVEGHAIGLRRDLRSRRVTALEGGDAAASGPSLTIDGTDLTRGLGG